MKIVKIYIPQNEEQSINKQVVYLPVKAVYKQFYKDPLLSDEHIIFDLCGMELHRYDTKIEQIEKVKLILIDNRYRLMFDVDDGAGQSSVYLFVTVQFLESFPIPGEI